MKHLFFYYAWILGNLRKRFPKTGCFQRASSTSIIKFDNEKKQVIKKVMLYENYHVVQNEVHWLSELSGFEHTPELISYEDNCLTMTYAGERLGLENLPTDWESQMDIILQKLIEINCSHNDIKPTDLLVLNGKLMLIDFQWATECGSELPSNWPKYIGRFFKRSDGTYDDQFSFKKSIEWVINN